MMKRFAVFAGHDYEASGGWKDLVGSHSSLTAAKTRVRKRTPPRGRSRLGHTYDGFHFDWIHVVDLETGKTVWENDE